MDKYWIKRNWKNIALGVLCLLWMTQCTKTCTSRSVVKTNDIIIDSLKTVISENTKTIENQANDIEWMARNKEDLKGVSNSNQAQLMDRITELNKENGNLEKTNVELHKEIDRLKRDTTRLGVELRNINK